MGARRYGTAALGALKQKLRKGTMEARISSYIWGTSDLCDAFLVTPALTLLLEDDLGAEFSWLESSDFLTDTPESPSSELKGRARKERARTVAK